MKYLLTLSLISLLCAPLCLGKEGNVSEPELVWDIFDPMPVYEVFGIVGSGDDGFYEGFDPDFNREEFPVIDLINQSRLWATAVYLENTSRSFPECRKAGTSGNLEARQWVSEQLMETGLEVWDETVYLEEDMNTRIWRIISTPYFALDLDGDKNTTEDRIELESRGIVEGSPSSNIFSDLVALPLLESCWTAARMSEIDRISLDSINTTGKAVLCPAEFLTYYKTRCMDYLFYKFETQPPLAFILAPYLEETEPEYYPWVEDYPIICTTYLEGEKIRNAAGSSETCLVLLLETNQQPETSQELHNLIAYLPGDISSGKKIIVCAHYDTVETPGFVDNSLGVAATLEMARVFGYAASSAMYRCPFDLEFIFFDGEEQGLLGSRDYVDTHNEEMNNVLAVFNFDVIGLEYPKYMPTKDRPDLAQHAHFPALLSETDELLAHNLDPNLIIEEAAKSLGSDLIKATSTPGSDHRSFQNIAPALCLCSGVTNTTTITFNDAPLIHSPSDSEQTPDWASPRKAGELTITTCLAILQMGMLYHDSYTPEMLVSELSAVVDSIETSQIRIELQNSIKKVGEDLSHGVYVQALQRSEVIYSLAQLLKIIDTLEDDTSTSLLEQAFEKGRTFLEKNPSSWYNFAASIQSGEAYECASIIGNFSLLYEEARDKLDFDERDRADRHLEMSIRAFEGGGIEMAMQYSRNLRTYAMLPLAREVLKDLEEAGDSDLFVAKTDYDLALIALSASDYETTQTYLAKILALPESPLLLIAAFPLLVILIHSNTCLGARLIKGKSMV